MIKASLIFAALFGVSCIGIMIGYYNSILGYDYYPVQSVFKDIPVIQASLTLVLTCPLSLVLAFRTSKGDYDAFTLELYAASCIFAFLACFIFLPGRGAVSIPHLDENLEIMWAILIPGQMFTCQILRLDFWRMATRGADGR